MRWAREKTDLRDDSCHWLGEGLGGVGMALNEQED
jgi:hypothetical protein